MAAYLFPRRMTLDIDYKIIIIRLVSCTEVASNFRVRRQRWMAVWSTLTVLSNKLDYGKINKGATSWIVFMNKVDNAES